jgi:hypothetical protein
MPCDRAGSRGALGRAVAVVAALIASGCTPELCARSSDCAGGLVCTVQGACAIPADAAIDASPGGSPADLHDAAVDAAVDAATATRRDPAVDARRSGVP